MSSPSGSSPLFLGLDLSTQQLKAIVLDKDSKIVHEAAIHFDRDLPAHGTTNGAILGPDDGEVTSPVAMWIEAIDLLLQKLADGKIEFKDIVSVSGDGQQHGSVYWSNASDKLLASLDSTKSLAEQLSPAAFSFPRAPIWQDSSTMEDCKKMEAEVGGAQALADLSGSRAYERFTGNQISRIRRKFPEIYEATAHISLVSSFVTSLFLGRIAPIDISDASGMNLMNVLTCKWDSKLLDICGGPALRAKLGEEPVIGGTSLGHVSDWWVKRWGFNPECIVAPFTGDNPATVMSVGAPGDALLSLGTSTTFLLSIPPSSTPPKRFTSSHLLAHPTSLETKIAMLCYKNGALARELVRDQFAKGQWQTFNELVEATPPGCNGIMGFYFPLPEIIPPNVVGEYFFTTDLIKTTVKPPLVAESVPPSIHPRAILESQFLSIRSRIVAMLPSDSPPLRRLVISGGSSQNLVIRQIAADIFGMDVYVSATKEAAASGGALLAKYAWWKLLNPNGTFEEMTGREVTGLQCVARPRKDISDIYSGLVSVYGICEQQVVDIWASRPRN
ncbi:D-xylulose kinase [Gymnopilus junonius]|uniref:Xylulose kinase n=1 Tax=Gymnopilus junonius TaxID=109634 RepID=A0A9P5TQ80_GYMJU|nr:D-xylulose kinase [Gymnopilus junonius]